jgi:large subunit ribosomal protein L1
MNTEQIAENIDAILKRLEGKLERGKLNIGSVYVKTSMGPPMRIV